MRNLPCIRVRRLLMSQTSEGRKKKVLPKEGVKEERGPYERGGGEKGTGRRRDKAGGEGGKKVNRL